MGDQKLHHLFVPVERGPVESRSAKEAPAVMSAPLSIRNFATSMWPLRAAM